MNHGIVIDQKSLRNFGIGLAVILAIIAALSWWRGSYITPVFGCLAIIGFIMGLAWPAGLKPVYRVFMMVGGVLGWINTRILLALIFFLMFTPVSCVLRLLGKDILDQKIDKGAKSYWRDREECSPETYDHPF